MILHGAEPLYSGKSGFAGVQNVFYLGKSYFAGCGGSSIRIEGNREFFARIVI